MILFWDSASNYLGQRQAQGQAVSAVLSYHKRSSSSASLSLNNSLYDDRLAIKLIPFCHSQSGPNVQVFVCEFSSSPSSFHFCKATIFLASVIYPHSPAHSWRSKWFPRIRRILNSPLTSQQSADRKPYGKSIRNTHACPWYT